MEREEMQALLEEMETRLSKHMDDVAASLETRLSKRMDDMAATMDNMAASLEQSIRDAQTEVLKAVYSTQEGNITRLNALETSLPQRMAIVERRLLEIEKKLGGVV